MYRRTGFTIVELVVVMIIMAILLVLAGFMVNNSQANARDSQRNSAAASIARGLETFYKQGNMRVTTPSYATTAGSYPDVTEMKHIFGQNVGGFSPSYITGGYSNDALPGTQMSDFTPPGVTGGAYAGFVIASCSGSCPAVNDSAATGSTTGAATTKDEYYYEPIDTDGNICSGEACVRYNLYWHTEVDDTTHIIRSKHQ